MTQMNVPRPSNTSRPCGPHAVTAALLSIAVLNVALTAGCGSRETASVAAGRVSAESAAAPKTAPAMDGLMGMEAEAAATDGAAGSLVVPADRKIVYTADLTLVVEDLTAFVADARAVTAAAGGFIGDVSESGRQGSYRTATLVMRVPSAEYGSLLGQLSALGEVDSRRETAADVTEEFVDVEARIANKRREETRLVELLEDATGSLAEVLAVEKELSRVRGEVERFEGRLNVLKDQISLSTITVSAEERRDYTPRRPRTLGEQASTAWSNSIRRVGQFFNRAAVEVVAFVPWLVVWVPLGLVAWAVVRFWRRGRRRP